MLYVFCIKSCTSTEYTYYITQCTLYNMQYSLAILEFGHTLSKEPQNSLQVARTSNISLFMIMESVSGQVSYKSISKSC